MWPRKLGKENREPAAANPFGVHVTEAAGLA
jgi:hypothetical protein